MTAKEDRERNRETLPQRIPDTTPPVYPGSDYSFTLQAVMEIQKAVGKLTQAVETLIAKTDKHEIKLDEIGKDVHAFKVAVGVATAIIVGVFGLIGWIVTTYISAHPTH